MKKEMKQIELEIQEAQASKFGDYRSKNLLITFLIRHNEDFESTERLKIIGNPETWIYAFEVRELERAHLLQLVDEDVSHLYKYYKKQLRGE